MKTLSKLLLIGVLLSINSSKQIEAAENAINKLSMNAIADGTYGVWRQVCAGPCSRPERLLGAVIIHRASCVLMYWEMDGKDSSYSFTAAGFQNGDEIAMVAQLYEKTCRIRMQYSEDTITYDSEHSDEDCMTDLGAGGWLSRWKQHLRDKATTTPNQADIEYRSIFPLDKKADYEDLCLQAERTK